MSGKKLYEKYKGHEAVVDNCKGIVCGYSTSYPYMVIEHENGWPLGVDNDVVADGKDRGIKVLYVVEDEIIGGVIEKPYVGTTVNIVNESKHELPKYSTEKSAGMDLRANIDEAISLSPLGRAIIPTGIKIQLGDGLEAQIRPRSGMAAKHGVTVLNTPGTIDADYNGEIKVILINISNEEFVVNDGDRIAQMVVAKYEKVDLNKVEQLDDTERGEGGFGHTGVK